MIRTMYASAPKMTLHSISNEKPRKEVPKKVLAAERFLRKNFPLFYSKVASYRNCEFISELELVKISFLADRLGGNHNWNYLKGIVYQFMGIGGEPKDRIPKRKKLLREQINHRKDYYQRAVN